MSALRNIRILELAEGVAGEYCGKLLADFGADVIKIERPGTGSPTRSMGPYAGDMPGLERSGLFAFLNTNKSSVTIDLASADGRTELSKLLSEADVVIDDHAPGWLKAIGLDPQRFQEALPRLILCSVTPYGQNPPKHRTYAEDLNVLHSSCWGYHTPSASDGTKPPLKGAGRFMVSYEGGQQAAICVVSALFERGLSKQGQFIDVSKQEAMASRLDYVVGAMVAGDEDFSAKRTALDLLPGGSIFPCRDGYAYFQIALPQEWEALRELLGAPAWMNEDFPENWLMTACTPERLARFRRHLGEWVKPQERSQFSQACQQHGLMAVPVNDLRDLSLSAQYAFREFFKDVTHPVIGTCKYPTVPYKLSETPARIETPAPRLGQHTNEKSTAARTPATAHAPAAAQVAFAPAEHGGPLQGVRVVDLTKVWAGPFASKLLAYLGAEVIKVESRNSIDPARWNRQGDINDAPGFRAVNPQKKSVQIDMKTKEGVALILDLIKKSDVVVENLRPGAVKRLGLGYDAVKAVRPEIVYVSMSMHGTEGPLSYQTGYAQSFAALSGVTSSVGYEGAPPVGMNIRHGDAVFGTRAAFGAVVALLHRQRTGIGQFVDVAAAESLSTSLADRMMDFFMNGRSPACDGNLHAEMAPHGAYSCRGEEWISIAVSSDQSWRALAEAIGRPGLPDDPRFNSLAGRKANEGELNQLIAEWTARRHAGDLAADLQLRGVAAAKSATLIDLISDPHLWATGFFPTVTDHHGQRPVVGPSWRMTRGARITAGAPCVGEHNAYVLGGILGLSLDEQRRLAETKVVY